MGQKTEEALESAWLNAEQRLTAARVRIRDLERQLREVRGAAQAQSEAIQRDWLSPAEAEGLRRRNLKLEEQLEAAAQLAHTDERWLNKYARHVRELETERQEHQDVEWERNALRERIVRHISDQLDYWKQEAAR